MPLSLPASFRTVSAWAVSAIVSLLFVIGLAAAPIATADTCDNAALRAQSNSTALPDCRAYEMVSPPYKEGFPVEALDFSDDGIVSYRSGGVFAGAVRGTLLLIDYFAARSSGGWVTTAPGPSEAIYNADVSGLLGAASDDLRSSVWMMSRRGAPEDAPEAVFGFWLRGPDGALTRIGDADTPAGTRPGIKLKSPDLSHIVFSNGIGTAEASALWEHVGTGNSSAREVSVDNHGQPTVRNSCPNAMSDDGRVIVYTSGCLLSSERVRARIGGSASVLVSGSECTRTSGDPGGVCNGFSPAAYVGAARDGSRVFFTTSQQLVNGDIDQTSDLYACDIPDGVPAPVGAANPCESLTQISGTATNAQVENVVAVSDDASRVVFVAQGVLASNVGVGDVRAATAGDLFGQTPHNMYVWERDEAHPAGQTRFVARLPSNDLAPPAVPAPAQMTPDGRYLLFMTDNGLVPGDDDGVRDVYRYDASSGVMVRVSTSVAGGGGNASAAASFGGAGSFSSISSDGSTVVFDTDEALSAADTNGITDVYSWRNGQVSMISAGSGGAAAVGVTPSGRDMFFTTKTPLLAADGDVISDIYNARVGGGFDPPRPPAPCSGDGCQGLLSATPGLAGPRSGLSGGGDSGDAAAVLSLRVVSAAQRRRLAATGRISLTVKANVTGRVSATARAKIGGRSVTVASGRQTMTTPGSVAIALTLSRKARSRLAARGRLTVKVVVSHSEAAKGRSVILKLTRARASKQSSVGGRS